MNPLPVHHKCAFTRPRLLRHSHLPASSPSPSLRSFTDHQARSSQGGFRAQGFPRWAGTQVSPRPPPMASATAFFGGRQEGEKHETAVFGGREWTGKADRRTQRKRVRERRKRRKRAGRAGKERGGGRSRGRKQTGVREEKSRGRETKGNRQQAKPRGDRDPPRGRGSNQDGRMERHSDGEASRTPEAQRPRGRGLFSTRGGFFLTTRPWRQLCGFGNDQSARTDRDAFGCRG